MSSAQIAAQHIQVEKRAPLAIVTVNRPHVRNALNSTTLAELNAALAELRKDDEVRVVLITGAGEAAFASGADLSELAGLTPPEAATFAIRAHEIFRRLETLGKPVVACIRGYALGGGCELAMACTLRIAADTARLGHPEVKFGLMAGYGGTQRLPRLVGRGAALKLLLTGEIISAQEALRIGLVDEVVPAAELAQRVEQIALAIARNAPLAVTATLQAVDELLDWRNDNALLREAERFGRLFDTEDKTEGTRAFLEKRPPVWKGR